MSVQLSPGKAFPDIFPPREIRILGAGRFGKMAARRLQSRFPDARLLITDENPDRAEHIGRELGISFAAGEAIDSIESPLADQVWIIPAVPVHVGFEWLLRQLDRKGTVRRLPTPESMDSIVPNPIRSPSGALYASFATFLCPDYCPEPDELCTTTGKPRLGNLFELLGAIAHPEFDTAVLRSWQLAPGVGGYPVRSLKQQLSTVAASPGKYLVATACRCHGVIDALEWSL